MGEGALVNLETSRRCLTLLAIPFVHASSFLATRWILMLRHRLSFSNFLKQSPSHIEETNQHAFGTDSNLREFMVSHLLIVLFPVKK